MGNKLAILAGDFLLARASVTLASLRNTEVRAGPSTFPNRSVSARSVLGH